MAGMTLIRTHRQHGEGSLCSDWPCHFTQMKEDNGQKQLAYVYDGKTEVKTTIQCEMDPQFDQPTSFNEYYSYQGPYFGRPN